MALCKVCGEVLTKKGDMYVCDICGYTCPVETNTSKPSNGNNEIKTQPTPKENDEDLFAKVAKAKSDLAEKCAKSVMKIYCYFSEGGATGSGWRASNEYIVTNAHVVEAENGEATTGKVVVEYSDYLKLGNRQKQEMMVVYFDNVEDIAILKPRFGMDIPHEVPVLNIVREKTHLGEPVFTIGNPLHYKFTYIEGTVANPDYHQEGMNRKYPVLQTTITLNHGNSGGAVFNAKGDVVGMSTFSELQPDENSFGLGMKEILGYGFCVTGIAIDDAINSLTRR